MYFIFCAYFVNIFYRENRLLDWRRLEKLDQRRLEKLDERRLEKLDERRYKNPQVFPHTFPYPWQVASCKL